jgi:hypothetical protein
MHMLSRRCGKGEFEYGDEGRTLWHLFNQRNLETDIGSLDRRYGNIDITIPHTVLVKQHTLTAG